MTKSKAKHMRTEIPTDMRNEILARLPVVALLRFKCVCKSWLALITSASFIAKHLEVSRSNRHPNLLVRNKSNYHIFYPGAFEKLQGVSYTIPLSVKWPRIVGSCDGLVCNYDDGIGIIWNPATRETKVMPPCSVQGSETQAVGFGFDSIENDYKVCVIHLFKTDCDDAGCYSDTEGELEIKSEAEIVASDTEGEVETGSEAEEEDEIEAEAETETEANDNADADDDIDDDPDANNDYDSNSDSDVEWLKIEVYSLRLDSWKLVTGYKMKKKRLFYIVEEVGVHNNGVISWVAYGKRNDPKGIYSDDSSVALKEEMISFDINKEVITRTPLPTDIAIHQDLEINNYVGVKDGDLAVLNAVKHEDDGDETGLFVLFSLWKLPEIGNKDSWKKSLAIDRPLEWFSPTWVIWNDSLVFWNYNNLQDQQNHQTLSFFDIDKEKKYELQLPKQEGHGLEFVTYRESLISINQRMGTVWE